MQRRRLVADREQAGLHLHVGEEVARAQPADAVGRPPMPGQVAGAGLGRLAVDLEVQIDYN